MSALRVHLQIKKFRKSGCLVTYLQPVSLSDRSFHTQLDFVSALLFLLLFLFFLHLTDYLREWVVL